MKLDGHDIFRIILFIFTIIGLTFFVIIPWIRESKLYNESSYNDKIKGIEIRSGNRGIATILTDSTWRLLTLDESNKIQDYIQVGDSIVKKSGERKITVFRRASNGQTLKKEFE